VKVAGQLRAQLAGVIAALPQPVSGGTDLHRQLGVGSTLCWHLHTFATAEDPVAALSKVPGRPSMERFIRSARKRGVPEAALERFDLAFEQFERFSAEHARDRSTLTALLRGVSNVQDSSGSDLVRRRSAFRDNGHLWGVQARTVLRCVIWNQGQAPGTHDGALLSGHVDVSALRPGVPLSLKTRTATTPTSAPIPGNLDPGRKATAGLQLLEEFSSRPTPELHVEQDPSGASLTTIRLEGVGNHAAVDCFTSEFVRDAGRGEPQINMGMMSLITVPAETFLADLLVWRGWSDPSKLTVTTHGNPAHVESLRAWMDQNVLPVRETATYLGTDLDSMQNPDVPRYPEMVASVLRQMGWQNDEFDIYRCRVRYPILHSMLHLRVGPLEQG